MYRWTDPIEPDGVPRRPEPPTDAGPAWLTDRPEPRSSYLFGDEPEQPSDDWADAPTGVWRADAPPAPWRDAATPERTGHLPTADAGHPGWAAAGRYADTDRTPATSRPSGSRRKARRPIRARRLPRSSGPPAGVRPLTPQPRGRAGTGSGAGSRARWSSAAPPRPPRWW